jgi:hypothetical protein
MSVKVQGLTSLSSFYVQRVWISQSPLVLTNQFNHMVCSQRESQVDHYSGGTLNIIFIPTSEVSSRAGQHSDRGIR